MAGALDMTARGGLDGLKALYAKPGGEPAFFGMAQAAAMLARVRQADKSRREIFWGVDYEVAGDRFLISRLESKVMNQICADRRLFARIRPIPTHSR
ncbi:MAG: hypothetical protein HXY23_00595 [Parvularculaceae bacterium]|jgi:hypothetical protein|nr:hypothetical protein [Parvularculaceae bacterium]